MATSGMARSDHPNVELVRRGFEAMAAGDLDAVINLYAPDLKYYASDLDGRPRVFASRDELFGLVAEAMVLDDEHSNELVDAFAVGDSLVMAHIRGHRRSRATQEILEMDYIMALRIDDGVVTQGVDLIDAVAESYFARLAPG